jgi:hypothetical protein
MLRDLFDKITSLLAIILSIQQINKIKGEENDSNFDQLLLLQTFKMILTFSL